MKEYRDLYYIAALVDGEIKDPAAANKLREEIENNPELKFEYFVQSSVKELVSGRLKLSPAPTKIRQRLERNLSKELRAKPKSTLSSGISFNKPLIAWGGAIVLVIALTIIFFYRNSAAVYKVFALEQTGSNNMFVQARRNFQNILDGKLSPQFSSSDPVKIKGFFTGQGVSYPVYIPEINDWKLEGAVVSDDHGEKLAHHIYSAPGGKLIYLFQVDETEIMKHRFLTLTEDLISYLDSGRCYEFTEDGSVTLLTRIKGNIFAVVSNCSPAEVEKNLCGNNYR